MNAELAQGKPVQGILRQPTTRDLILLAVSEPRPRPPSSDLAIEPVVLQMQDRLSSSLSDLTHDGNIG